MTYFETPNQQQAFYAGMPVEAYEYMMDAQEQDMEALHEQNRPDLAVEDRPAVSERDMFDPATVWTVEAIDAMEADFYAMIGRTR